jgi:mono/diheme cytochrome c family protein
MRDPRTGPALLAAVLALVGGACVGKYIRPTTIEKIDATSERLARGSYIVNQNASCGACHTTREGGSILGGERSDMFLAGGSIIREEEMGAQLVLPNITPDVETGIGGWSDDQIMRAIRDGIGHDGHLLIPLMPFTSYQYMSDEDVRSVVAYLRTVPPVKNAVDRSKNELPFPMGFLLNRGVAHHPPAKDVAEVRPPSRGGDQVKWGEYVARLGHCWECHSDKKGHGPDTDWLFGGGAPMNLNGVGKVYVRNLTPDPETGLGRYSPAQIKAAIHDGKRLDGRPMAPPMSLFIPHISGLSDEDLDALVAYLRVQKPIKNQVKDRELAPATKKALGADS